jgi:cyclopropane fatty-acyl-phospholipid synthase-like methyltransferase
MSSTVSSSVNTHTAAFWDDVFSKGQACPYTRVAMPDPDDAKLCRAREHFGDLTGKTILDIGCGSGATSLFFAQQGAQVLSIDISAVAINNLKQYCNRHAIANITPIQMPAQGIQQLGPVDFVFGAMILHHIEPFEPFAATLRQTLAPGGKAFFWENNASSSFMMWCREHLTGRFGIPKHGDVEEHPLTPSEVRTLDAHLDVEVEYPELLYFRMCSTYFLGGRLEAPFKMLDDFFYRYSGFRKRSYRQYLLCTR